MGRKIIISFEMKVGFELQNRDKMLIGEEIERLENNNNNNNGVFE